MTYHVKDWHQFQHFKDRRPPWIKLYRQILDDIEWHSLSGDDAKHLVMMWLIASEDYGRLPSPKQLAFRLRITEQQLAKICIKLSHWLIQDDIAMISEGYRDDTPERAGEETETETETETDRFSDFWAAYPRKVGKAEAAKKWRAGKLGAMADEIIQDVLARITQEWDMSQMQFIPHPSTYLHGRRWEDMIIPRAKPQTGCLRGTTAPSNKPKDYSL